MTEWMDADFSDQSDSSDEEFVFREEDVAEDTSDSSEGEVSDGGDHNSIANQNTPQNTYGNHTVNGNSAATYGDSRYTIPPLTNGKGHGLDENGYTNDRPLRELGMPFEIFSDTFNQFHEEQEMTLKELSETEQEMVQMNTLLEEEIETVKEECNNLKTNYRDICDENKQIREYIEEMHSFLLPYFSNIMDNQGDEGNEKEVKEMDVDKNKSGDEDSEEKDDESEDDELDEVTLGPFLVELARRFAQ